nr:helix-turn-helix transcriptional regulator [Kibdelosporangium sp. MJ126-NF4]
MSTPDQGKTPAKESAPSVPPDFWEQPTLLAALRERHFGRFLRAYRLVHEPAIQQVQLAAWIGITQGQLSRIERGVSPVHDLAKLEAWSRAINVPQDLLWFKFSDDSNDETETPSTPNVVDPINEQNQGELKRRELFKAASAATVAVGSGLLANSPWQRLLDSVDNGRPVDSATVQLMQDRTADFFDTERTVPARQVLRALQKHRSVLTALVRNTSSGSIQHQLAVTLGETEALLGWLQFDLGHATDAANSWRATLKIAKETGDGALAACALGYWSYLAASRNDIEPAINLLQQAEQYVPGNSAPATRAWIAARQAEELGRLGNETDALRSIERAFTAFDFARPRTERVWTGFFTANRLGGLTVSTYVALDHKDANIAADSLLASLPPTDYKSRAIALTDLTRLAVRRKEYDHAYDLVGPALSTTIRTETSLARQKLMVLATSLAASRDDAATRDIHDQIISTLRRQ